MSQRYAAAAGKPALPATVSDVNISSRYNRWLTGIKTFILMLIGVVLIAPAGAQTVTYDNVGNHQFTVPNGVYCVYVRAWGGGGAGGGDGRTGGGGGGAFAGKKFNVYPGQVINFQVGDGGKRTDSEPSAFVPSQPSWFLNNTLLNAPGGASANTAGPGGGGATGGTGATGDVTFNGGDGAAGGAGLGNQRGGGGGGAANTTGNGTNASGRIGGKTGDGGDGGDAASLTESSLPPTAPGGGGFGGYTGNGSDGASGRIQIIYGTSLPAGVTETVVNCCPITPTITAPTDPSLRKICVGNPTSNTIQFTGGGIAGGLWAIDGDPIGVTVDQTGKITVAANAVPGCYTVIYGVKPDEYTETTVSSQHISTACRATSTFMVFPPPPQAPLVTVNNCAYNNFSITVNAPGAQTNYPGFTYYYRVSGSVSGPDILFGASGSTVNYTTATVAQCFTVEAYWVSFGSTCLNPAGADEQIFSTSCTFSPATKALSAPTGITLVAPAPVCEDVNNRFVLPPVTATEAPGYNAALHEVQYSVDGQSFKNAADWATTLPTSPGCHTVTARIVARDGSCVPAGTVLCTGSNTVNALIFPKPTVAPNVQHTCAGGAIVESAAIPAYAGFTVQHGYLAEGGTYPTGIQWTNAATIPPGFTPGCYSVYYRYRVSPASCGVANNTAAPACGISPAGYTVVFPATIALNAATNVCQGSNSGFVFPTVSTVYDDTKFDVLYSVNNGTYMSAADHYNANTVGNLLGCVEIRAKYVLRNSCVLGNIPIGTVVPDPALPDCPVSDPVRLIVYPVPTVAPSVFNTCAGGPIVEQTPVNPPTGFGVEYGYKAVSAATINWLGALPANVPVGFTPGCYEVYYRFTAGECPGASSTIPACNISPVGYTVVFPPTTVTVLPTSIDDICQGTSITFAAPATTPAGFTAMYSIDGGATWHSYANIITLINQSTPGCITLLGTWATTAACGNTPAGTRSTCTYGTSVQFVKYPTAPAAPAVSGNICRSAANSITVTPIPSVIGFTREYLLIESNQTPGATGWQASNVFNGDVPADCYNVYARYVLAADCGDALAGSAGTGNCGISQPAYVVVFPDENPSLDAVDDICAGEEFPIPVEQTFGEAPRARFIALYSLDNLVYKTRSEIKDYINGNPGCYFLYAKWALQADCGPHKALQTISPCASNDPQNFVVFPSTLSAPVVSSGNVCVGTNVAVNAITNQTNFTRQYKMILSTQNPLTDGTWGTSTTFATAALTPGCYTVYGRYILTIGCGSTGDSYAPAAPLECLYTAPAHVVIYPNVAPVVSAIANICEGEDIPEPVVTNSATFPGFIPVFSINGTQYDTYENLKYYVNWTIGCKTILARWALAEDCGNFPSLTIQPVGTNCNTSTAVNFVIFPAAPAAPSATSNICVGGTITIRAIPAKSGFTRQYRVVNSTGVDLQSWTNDGTTIANVNEADCYSIYARYILTNACGTVAANTTPPNDCAQSEAGHVVVFPAAPVISITDPKLCKDEIVQWGNFVTIATPLTGNAANIFEAQYQIVDGPSNVFYPANANVPVVNPGCFRVVVRYGLKNACGNAPRGTFAEGLACEKSNELNYVVYPDAPQFLNVSSNVCEGETFVLPPVLQNYNTALFNVEYSINGGAYSVTPTLPTTAGCYEIKARFILKTACGNVSGQAEVPCLESVSTFVVIFPAAPILTQHAPDNFNVCEGSAPAMSLLAPTITVTDPQFKLQYSVDGKPFVDANVLVLPTNVACHNIKARYVLALACGTNNYVGEGSTKEACKEGNTVYWMTYPTAPVLVKPVNVCEGSAFRLPDVENRFPELFQVQWQIDGDAWTEFPVLVKTPGCHSIQARFVLRNAPCGPNGPTLPYMPAPANLACYASNIVNVVVFPTPPVLAVPVNICYGAGTQPITVPTVATVPQFITQYYITVPKADGTGAENLVPSDPDGWVDASALPALPTTPGCYLFKARYILAADCISGVNPNDGYPARTEPPAPCKESNEVSAVIFPNAPVLTRPDNVCNEAFVLPPVAAVPYFTVEYTINGTGSTDNWTSTPTVPVEPGCYGIKARYILTSTCGVNNPAGTVGPIPCNESDTVFVVIYPRTPDLGPQIISACSQTIVIGPYEDYTYANTFRFEFSYDNGATWTYDAQKTVTLDNDPDNCDIFLVKRRWRLISPCIGGQDAADSTLLPACVVSPATRVVVDVTAPKEITTGIFAASFPDRFDIDTCAAPAGPTTDQVKAVFRDNCSNIIFVEKKGIPVYVDCKFDVTYEYHVKDTCGNVAIHKVRYTGWDQTKPVIVSSPANATYECAADVPVGVPAAITVSDNCDPEPDITVADVKTQPDPNKPNHFTIVRTWTVKDNCNNTVTVSQTITVADDTAPVISICGPDRTIYTSIQNCQATLPDYRTQVKVTDNCTDLGALVVTQTPAAGSPLTVGANTVSFTVTDADGNISLPCTITVTVLDTVPPVITNCPQPRTQQSGGSICDFAVPDFTNGLVVTDNCSGSVTVTQSPAAGTMVKPGSHTIIITATDAYGNAKTCITQFIVEDLIKPVFVSCPANATVNGNLTGCKSNYQSVSPVATDNCGIAILTWELTGATISKSPDDGINYVPLDQVYNLGVTKIKYTAFDFAGNSATCEYNVTVTGSTLVGTATVANGCNSQNGVVTLSATGGNAPYKFSFDNSNFDNVKVFNVPAGSYVAIVEDAAGCKYNYLVEVKVSSPITVSTSITNVSCIDPSKLGSVTVNASGGTAPYTISFNGGAFQSDNKFENLKGGTYSIVVKDALGCTSSSSATIIEGSDVNVVDLSAVATHISCNGNAGAVDLTAKFIGGSGNLSISYKWYKEGSNDVIATTEDLTNIGAGKYTVIITVADAGSPCTNTFNATATVSSATPVVATATGTRTVALNSTPSPVVTFGATGGVAPYVFEYNVNGGASQTLNGGGSVSITQSTGTAGVFTYKLISVTDANSCKIPVNSDVVITVGDGNTNPPNPTVTPDLSIQLLILPAIARGETDMEAVISVYEINNKATSGQITVFMSKDDKISVDYAAGTTTMLGKSLNNSVWTLDNSNSAAYIFRSTAVIPGEGTSVFGFKLKFKPGNTKGNASITATILGGSGGETRVSNNVDSEGIDYFIN